MYTADRRLYVTKDGKRVVEENDPDAYMLLVGEGQPVTDEMIKQYGLKEPKAKPAAGQPAADDAEEKAVKSAPENKAHTGKSTK